MKELRHPNIVIFYGVSVKYESVEIVCMTTIELCAGFSDSVDLEPFSWCSYSPAVLSAFSLVSSIQLCCG